MKKTLTQKQIADYEQLCRDRNNGRLLTPDGLRFICEANNYDPEAIGLHFLEMLAKKQQR
ncbi:MAG: cytochrome C [Ruminococcaceae bacterium]|nr:cytochrome C [Oscillospiraceae bacterium]